MNSLWSCNLSHGTSASRKDSQFAFGNVELREPALLADLKLWEYPHDGLVQTLESGKMDVHFTVKRALLVGCTSLTRHSYLLTVK